MIDEYDIGEQPTMPEDYDLKRHPVANLAADFALGATIGLVLVVLAVLISRIIA